MILILLLCIFCTTEEKEKRLNIHKIKEKISSIQSDVEIFEVASNIATTLI